MVAATGRAALMKVSEKSLELNIGAELLTLMRGPWRMPKAYLRGLTQREESQEGVDFFAQLPRATRVYAFQFKAPKGRHEGEPYRFTIQRRQHGKLHALARNSRGGVYYVLPYYVSPAKLEWDVPHLLRDTWMLSVSGMRVVDVFGTCKSRTVRCSGGMASVNPDYALQRGFDMEPDPGIPVRQFAEWYGSLRDEDDGVMNAGVRRSPWLVRGLRVVVVPAASQR